LPLSSYSFRLHLPSAIRRAAMGGEGRKIERKKKGGGGKREILPPQTLAGMAGERKKKELTEGKRGKGETIPLVMSPIVNRGEKITRKGKKGGGGGEKGGCNLRGLHRFVSPEAWTKGGENIEEKKGEGGDAPLVVPRGLAVGGKKIFLHLTATYKNGGKRGGGEKGGKKAFGGRRGG